MAESMARLGASTFLDDPNLKHFFQMELQGHAGHGTVAPLQSTLSQNLELHRGLLGRVKSMASLCASALHDDSKLRHMFQLGVQGRARHGTPAPPLSTLSQDLEEHRGLVGHSGVEELAEQVC